MEEVNDKGGDERKQTRLAAEREKPRPGSLETYTGANLSLGERASIVALDSLGATKTKIAQEVGVSRNTVSAVLKNGDHTDPRIVERVKKEMAGHFWVTASRAASAITPEKLEAASALQLATVAAIGTDKALLLDGKPTVRIEHQSTGDAEAASKIEELEAQLAGWKDGTTINAEMVDTVVDTEGASPTE